MCVEPLYSEHYYKLIMDQYLEDQIVVDEFIKLFIAHWRRAHDASNNYDERFNRLISRLFTSCDCYSKEPEGPFEILEMELKNEVQIFRWIWWG